ncbi:AB-hydrolase lipase domain [Trinorchestia longiramus]|nr:AB-hydrolase lipase domain [Trinorchestia longiramus]
MLCQRVLLCLLVLILTVKTHTHISYNGTTEKIGYEILLEYEKNLEAKASGSSLKKPRKSISGDQNFVETRLLSKITGDQNWVESTYSSNIKEEQTEAKKLHKHQTLNVTPQLQQADAFQVPSPYMALNEGYLFEEHFVTTSDGYILALHRIPGPRGMISASVSTRKPVLLMHGLFLSSISFLALGPAKSLGYLLADAGYDVWMGNFRGNTYSRNHTTLSPDSDPEFWEFSQDEMAQHDIPALVQHVLTSTGAGRLDYIGYSQGARTALMAATDPSLAQKINVMVVLASTGARTLSGTEATNSQLLGEAWRFLELIGKREIVSHNLGLVQLLSNLCTGMTFMRDICTDAVSAYSGQQIIRDDLYQFRKEILPVILAHIFSGSSARQFSHQAQLANGILRKFDFRKSGNVEYYGTTASPEYNLNDVVCPVAVYWAVNDKRTPIQDVKRISKQIPNVVKVHQIESKSFNHLDFIFAEQATNLLYDHVIGLLDEYKQPLQVL